MQPPSKRQVAGSSPAGVANIINGLIEKRIAKNVSCIRWGNASGNATHPVPNADDHATVTLAPLGPGGRRALVNPGYFELRRCPQWVDLTHRKAKIQLTAFECCSILSKLGVLVHALDDDSVPSMKRMASRPVQLANGLFSCQ